MKLCELNNDQLHELRVNYLTTKADERGEGVSWSEMIQADDLVTFQDLETEYAGIDFCQDDFFCSFRDIVAA